MSSASSIATLEYEFREKTFSHDITEPGLYIITNNLSLIQIQTLFPAHFSNCPAKVIPVHPNSNKTSININIAIWLTPMDDQNDQNDQNDKNSKSVKKNQNKTYAALVSVLLQNPPNFLNNSTSNPISIEHHLVHSETDLVCTPNQIYNMFSDTIINADDIFLIGFTGGSLFSTEKYITRQIVNQDVFNTKIEEFYTWYRNGMLGKHQDENEKESCSKNLQEQIANLSTQQEQKWGKIQQRITNLDVSTTNNHESTILELKTVKSQNLRLKENVDNLEEKITQVNNDVNDHISQFENKINLQRAQFAEHNQHFEKHTKHQIQKVEKAIDGIVQNYTTISSEFLNTQSILQLHSVEHKDISQKLSALKLTVENQLQNLVPKITTQEENSTTITKTQLDIQFKKFRTEIIGLSNEHQLIIKGINETLTKIQNDNNTEKQRNDQIRTLVHTYGDKITAFDLKLDNISAQIEKLSLMYVQFEKIQEQIQKLEKSQHNVELQLKKNQQFGESLEDQIIDTNKRCELLKNQLNDVVTMSKNEIEIKIQEIEIKLTNKYQLELEHRCMALEMEFNKRIDQLQGNIVQKLPSQKQPTNIDTSFDFDLDHTLDDDLGIDNSSQRFHLPHGNSSQINRKSGQNQTTNNGSNNEDDIFGQSDDDGDGDGDDGDNDDILNETLDNFDNHNHTDLPKHDSQNSTHNLKNTISCQQNSTLTPNTTHNRNYSSRMSSINSFGIHTPSSMESSHPVQFSTSKFTPGAPTIPSQTAPTMFQNSQTSSSSQGTNNSLARANSLSMRVQKMKSLRASASFDVNKSSISSDKVTSHNTQLVASSVEGGSSSTKHPNSDHKMDDELDSDEKSQDVSDEDESFNHQQDRFMGRVNSINKYSKQKVTQSDNSMNSIQGSSVESGSFNHHDGSERKVKFAGGDADHDDDFDIGSDDENQDINNNNKNNQNNPNLSKNTKAVSFAPNETFDSMNNPFNDDSDEDYDGDYSQQNKKSTPQTSQTQNASPNDRKKPLPSRRSAQYLEASTLQIEQPQYNETLAIEDVHDDLYETSDSDAAREEANYIEQNRQKNLQKFDEHFARVQSTSRSDQHHPDGDDEGFVGGGEDEHRDGNNTDKTNPPKGNLHQQSFKQPTKKQRGNTMNDDGGSDSGNEEVQLSGAGHNADQFDTPRSTNNNSQSEHVNKKRQRVSIQSSDDEVCESEQKTHPTNKNVGKNPKMDHPSQSLPHSLSVSRNLTHLEDNASKSSYGVLKNEQKYDRDDNVNQNAQTKSKKNSPKDNQLARFRTKLAQNGINQDNESDDESNIMITYVSSSDDDFHNDDNYDDMFAILKPHLTTKNFNKCDNNFREYFETQQHLKNVKPKKSKKKSTKQPLHQQHTVPLHSHLIILQTGLRPDQRKSISDLGKLVGNCFLLDDILPVNTLLKMPSSINNDINNEEFYNVEFTSLPILPTHIVTNNLNATFKLLASYSTSTHIVTPQWLNDSIDGGVWIDESNYQVVDKASEQNHRFNFIQSFSQNRFHTSICNTYFIQLKLNSNLIFNFKKNMTKLFVQLNDIFKLHEYDIELQNRYLVELQSLYLQRTISIQQSDYSSTDFSNAIFICTPNTPIKHKPLATIIQSIGGIMLPLRLDSCGGDDDDDVNDAKCDQLVGFLESQFCTLTQNLAHQDGQIVSSSNPNFDHNGLTNLDFLTPLLSALDSKTDQHSDNSAPRQGKKKLTPTQQKQQRDQKLQNLIKTIHKHSSDPHFTLLSLSLYLIYSHLSEYLLNPITIDEYHSQHEQPIPILTTNFNTISAQFLTQFDPKFSPSEKNQKSEKLQKGTQRGKKGGKENETLLTCQQLETFANDVKMQFNALYNRTNGGDKDNMDDVDSDIRSVHSSTSSIMVNGVTVNDICDIVKAKYYRYFQTFSKLQKVVKYAQENIAAGGNKSDNGVDIDSKWDLMSNVDRLGNDNNHNNTNKNAKTTKTIKNPKNTKEKEQFVFPSLESMQLFVQLYEQLTMMQSRLGQFLSLQYDENGIEWDSVNGDEKIQNKNSPNYLKNNKNYKIYLITHEDDLDFPHFKSWIKVNNIPYSFHPQLISSIMSQQIALNDDVKPDQLMSGRKKKE